MKTVVMLLVPLSLLAAQSQPATPNPYVEREVARQMSKLLYVSIFDDISYRVEGYNVILTGEVRRPLLRSDAEKLVRQVEGVDQVINHIEVLPLSPNDEAIRRATYLALIRQPTLQSYFWPNVWSIHIIVKNGDVKLVGLVSNQADANLANLAARSVPGTFSFVSQLTVADPPTATRTKRTTHQ
jgi:hyperosmotically inducible protein